jgi:hypothetical protein
MEHDIVQGWRHLKRGPELGPSVRELSGVSISIAYNAYEWITSPIGLVSAVTVSTTKGCTNRLAPAVQTMSIVMWYML